MSNNDKHNKHKSNPNNNQENQYQASPMDQGDKIVDMKKFDQSDIMKLIQHATEIGKTSNEKLSKPFLDSILSMKLSGSDMHKDIGNHINNEHESVLKSFNSVFKSASDYVNATQNMQSTERPSDFKKDPIKDLLDTKSRGVPLEDKDFHNRIPKIEIAESPDDEATKPNVTPKPRTTPRIIRGKNTNNAVVGLSPAPKIGSVFEKLDNLIQYGKNAISGLISDLTKEPATTKLNEATKSTAKSEEDIDSVTKYPVKNLTMSGKKAEARLMQMEGGYRKKIYSDQTGTEVTKYDKKNGPTIGYGHLIKSPEEFEKYKNGITKEEAEELLHKDLPEYERIVKKYIKEDVQLTQNEYDALVMRSFNCGKGGFTYNNTHAKEMTDYINAGKDLKSEEFTRLYQGQRFSGGHYMQGVEIRRIRELDILQNNDYHEHDMKDYYKRIIYGPASKKSKK